MGPLCLPLPPAHPKLKTSEFVGFNFRVFNLAYNSGFNLGHTILASIWGIQFWVQFWVFNLVFNSGFNLPSQNWPLFCVRFLRRGIYVFPFLKEEVKKSMQNSMPNWIAYFDNLGRALGMAPRALTYGLNLLLPLAPPQPNLPAQPMGSAQSNEPPQPHHSPGPIRWPIPWHKWMATLASTLHEISPMPPQASSLRLILCHIWNSHHGCRWLSI